MPTYTYKCEECKNKIDVLRPMSESSLDVIRECSQKEEKTCTYKKTYSVNRSPFHFKGSGFYETDYKQNEELSSDE